MNIVYATATTNVGLPGGGTILVGAGTHWPDNDPVVLAHQDLFSSDPRYGLVFTAEPDGFRDPVETASAAPGERRTARRA
jgi:hypothetical protein